MGSENDILKLFEGEKLNKITINYYTVLANVFQQDFSCNIGFHLEDKIVYKLEFFREHEYYSVNNIYDSYLEFQTVLQSFFGNPTKVKPQFYSVWRFGFIEVLHCIHERFTLEEHVEIQIHTERLLG